MSRIRAKLTYANVMATIAVFVALGGTVYATSKIDGKTIKKASIPGNRLKKDAVTGTQVNEASLGPVPSATTAGSAAHATTADSATTAANAVTAANATTATTATTADNAAHLDGSGRAAFGTGVMAGIIENLSNPTTQAPPFGIFRRGTDDAIGMYMPGDATFRDFIGETGNGFTGDDQISFTLIVIPTTTGGPQVNTPLCTIAPGNAVCHANAVVQIPHDAVYEMQVAGTNLEGGESAGFNYRLAAG